MHGRRGLQIRRGVSGKVWDQAGKIRRNVGSLDFLFTFLSANGCLISFRECLVTGINFLLRNDPAEVFVYPDGEDASDPRPFSGGGPLLEPVVHTPAPGETIHPYLLANVGSGVSFVVVDENSQERIAGSALGGATYWGLVRALTSIRDYEESLELARSGSAENINMTVGDIYGGVPYKSLPPSMTAAFFGKAIADEPPLSRASEADVCNAVLFMVTNNLGQLAYLNALRCVGRAGLE